MPLVADIHETVESMKRVGRIFGTTIDLTHFYWSLRMPREVWDFFRLDGDEFHLLLLGWNFSPLIAQVTLGDLLHQYMDRFCRRTIVFFHYLDDILLLAHDRGGNLLRNKSLLISSKSQTISSATVTWIGKTFHLTKGTVCNTPGSIRKALAVVV